MLYWMRQSMKILPKFDTILTRWNGFWHDFDRFSGVIMMKWSAQVLAGAKASGTATEHFVVGPELPDIWEPAASLKNRPIISKARSRLDQRGLSRPNMHFSAFFTIYKKIIFSQAKFANFRNFCKFFYNSFEKNSQMSANFQMTKKSKLLRIF